jgi:hypothetical protein
LSYRSIYNENHAPSAYFIQGINPLFTFITFDANFPFF